MLAELKQHDIFVYVTTNGTLITEDVARRLVELELDHTWLFPWMQRRSCLMKSGAARISEKCYTIFRTLNVLKKQAQRDDKPILSIDDCAMQSNIQELPKLVRLADELNMTHGVAVMNIYEYGLSGESLVDHLSLPKVLSMKRIGLPTN